MPCADSTLPGQAPAELRQVLKAPTQDATASLGRKPLRFVPASGEGSAVVAPLADMLRGKLGAVQHRLGSATKRPRGRRAAVHLGCYPPARSFCIALPLLALAYC